MGLPVSWVWNLSCWEGLLEKKYKPLHKSWTPKSLAFQKKVSSTTFLRGFMLPAYIKDALSMKCLPRNLDDGIATAGLRWDLHILLLKRDLCDKAQTYNSRHQENFRLKSKHILRLAAFSTNKVFYHGFRFRLLRNTFIPAFGLKSSAVYSPWLSYMC